MVWLSQSSQCQEGFKPVVLSPQSNRKFPLKQTVKKERERERKGRPFRGLAHWPPPQDGLTPSAGEERGQILRWKINLQEWLDTIPRHAVYSQPRRMGPRGFSFPNPLYPIRPSRQVLQEHTASDRRAGAGVPPGALEPAFLSGLDLPLWSYFVIVQYS